MMVVVDEETYLRDNYLIQFRGETPPRDDFHEADYDAEGEYWSFVGYVVEDICYKHDNPMIERQWFPRKHTAKQEYRRRVRAEKIRCHYCLKEEGDCGR